ncbi:MAG: pyruvate kinase [Burkholderiales bacterium]|nr:pyruvate kinase [Burkholderiales bacterium]
MKNNGNKEAARAEREHTRARLAAGRRAARRIDRLRRAAVALEQAHASALAAVAPAMARSARNLLHYLAVRSRDVRGLQADLARLGLSSLGRMEAHTLATLDQVAAMLCLIRGRDLPADLRAPPALTMDAGDALLVRHAEAILGPPPAGRRARIMVTMPTEAAEDPQLVEDLVARGMQIMRINCAHDDAGAWARMIRHLRRAEKRLGRRCLVSFDLAGPKLRTGPVEPGIGVLKWRPRRDALGRTVAPAVVVFSAASIEAAPGWTVVPIDVALAARARRGDTIELIDARSRRRRLEVVAVTALGCVCHAERTAYVTPGTRLTLRRGGAAVAKAQVGELPPREQPIRLAAGDRLDLVCGTDPGRPARHDPGGRLLAPAMIACALPEVFASARAGERILFDDGRIEGRIRSVDKDRMRVEIVGAAGGVARLGAEKGINLPDTDLRLPALTDKDRADLDFVLRHADMVALSFVQRAADIEDLAGELAKRGTDDAGIVLKIETRRAFARLPELLLAALRHPRVAVMVARGDLGVEVGFERLAEVQEEMLWLCEAAHVPVIWATQVLESLAKGGMSSRAEVTDAAMGGRAECVMLNKGPFIGAAVSFLADVLQRMQGHQRKKTAILRRLGVSRLDGAAGGEAAGSERRRPRSGS